MSQRFAKGGVVPGSARLVAQSVASCLACRQTVFDFGRGPEHVLGGSP